MKLGCKPLHNIKEMSVDQLSVEDQIRLLELGIEVQILTAEDLERLVEMGLISKPE